MYAFFSSLCSFPKKKKKKKSLYICISLSTDTVAAALRKAGGADYDSGQVEGCAEVVGEAPKKKEFTRPGRPGKGGARLLRKPKPAAE